MKRLVVFFLVIFFGCAAPSGPERWEQEKINNEPATVIHTEAHDSTAISDETPVSPPSSKRMSSSCDSKAGINLSLTYVDWGDIRIAKKGAINASPYKILIENTSDVPFVVDPDLFYVTTVWKKKAKPMTDGEVIKELDGAYRIHEATGIEKREGALSGAVGGALLALVFNEIWVDGAYRGESMATGAITGGLTGAARGNQEDRAAHQRVSELEHPDKERVRAEILKQKVCYPGNTIRSVVFFPQVIKSLNVTFNKLQPPYEPIHFNLYFEGAELLPAECMINSAIMDVTIEKGKALYELKTFYLRDPERFAYVFLYPKTVRGMVVTMNLERFDLQPYMLYLPSMRRVRKGKKSQLSSRFCKTDFTLQQILDGVKKVIEQKQSVHTISSGNTKVTFNASYNEDIPLNFFDIKYLIRQSW